MDLLPLGCKNTAQVPFSACIVRVYHLQLSGLWEKMDENCLPITVASPQVALCSPQKGHVYIGSWRFLPRPPRLKICIQLYRWLWMNKWRWSMCIISSFWWCAWQEHPTPPLMHTHILSSCTVDKDNLHHPLTHPPVLSILLAVFMGSPNMLSLQAQVRKVLLVMLRLCKGALSCRVGSS